MAYCTLTDITALIPEQTVINLTDDAGIVTAAMLSAAAAGDDLSDLEAAEKTATEGCLARVTAAIADADAEIDSYCAARYQVPFSPVPAVIVKVSVDITVYNLYSRCAETIPETRKERYKNAIDLLRNISKGVVTLGVVPAPEANPQGSSRPEIVSSPRLFTRESLKGM